MNAVTSRYLDRSARQALSAAKSGGRNRIEGW